MNTIKVIAKLRAAIDLLEREADETPLERENGELHEEVHRLRLRVRELEAELAKLREGKAA